MFYYSHKQLDYTFKAIQYKIFFRFRSRNLSPVIQFEVELSCLQGLISRIRFIYSHPFL